MPHTVEVPDFGSISFPDEMSEDEIKGVLQAKFPPTTPDLTAGGRLQPGGLKPESGMESGTELSTALATGGQQAVRAVGKGLTKAGKATRDVVAAYGFEALGQPELQAAQLGISPEAVKQAGMIPEPESEKTPIELGMESLPTAARIPSEATYGLIESAPRLAGVVALQAAGVPAPAGAALMFGPTEKGFDIKQASIAAALPFVGKYSGEIAGLIAKQFGVESGAAMNAVKSAGAVGGPAAGLVAEGETEISKLPKEQQHEARINMWANVLGQSALGLTGLTPEKKGVPNAIEEGVIKESSQPEHPGTETLGVSPETGGGNRPEPVTEGQTVREVPLSKESPVEKMSPEQQAKADHPMGIEYGLTLSESDVPALEKKYKSANEAMQKAFADKDSAKQLAEGGKANFYGGALMGATKGKHPISGSNYDLYVQQKEAQAKIPPPKQYEEIGIGRETEQEASRSGNNAQTGLPPSVPPGPAHFPAELLEASRRLGTLVKSRTTLPAGTMGQYRRARIGQDDAIEVGDIRNQLTVSHEMGHDIDALIFPTQNLDHTQRSLGARVGEPGKDMQNELLPISELMRGPISGTKGHIAYRRRATELIADFFALYAHDPARARTMAPRFSAGFERALAGVPDAAETIRQLHAGNVEPVAPQTSLPPTGTPAEMPGAVPARPQPSPVARDAGLAVAAEDLVKGLVRTYKSEVEKAGVKADRWREDVPIQQDRNDVGAFVEGISNLEMPGDTIDSVKQRMTPEMKRLAKDYRFDIELQRQRVNEFLKGSSEGEYLKFLEDYLPHFYVNSKTPAGLQAISRFRKESPNAKQRKIPTLREAVDYGLKPITQDPAVLYELTANINWRVATNRKLLSEARNMQSGGQPIVMPPSEAPPGWPVSDNPLIQRVYAQQTPGGTLLWKGGAAVHPDAWRAFRMMLENPTSSGLTRAYDAINGLTRANAFAFSLFHDVTLRSASLGAQMQWYNPVRGLFRLFERNPLTGELEVFKSTRGVGKELLKDEQSVSDAALHGLEFAWHSSETYQHAARDLLEKLAVQLRDTPFIGKTARIARDIQRWRQEGLWKNTHDALKLASYEDITSKALQDLPKDSPEAQVKAVKENVASLLNDAFGGQEWQTKFWLSPQVRRTLARFWLAPDWTLSTLRSVPFVSDAFSITRGQLPRLAGREPIPTRGEGLSFDVARQTPTGSQRITYNNPTYGGLQRAKFWGAEIAALAMGTVAAQYAIYHAFGDKNKGDKEWTWENELGQNRRIDVTPLMRQFPWRKKEDPTRYYVNLGKRPEEIIGWVIHPEQNTLSKMARPVAEVFRQITGTEGDFKAEWKRDHEAFIESLPSRAKSIAGTLIPFTFSGNQFALSLPYRKGMTKYKAQEAYESAYELMAEPNKFRSIVRAQTTNLDKLVGDISDAAEKNGVPSETVRKRALSITRGKFYDKYFKAMQKDDKKGMEDAANALSRLGATSEGLRESMKRKMAVEPRVTEP